LQLRSGNYTQQISDIGTVNAQFWAQATKSS
jgi:hypothetical protein